MVPSTGAPQSAQRMVGAFLGSGAKAWLSISMSVEGWVCCDMYFLWMLVSMPLCVGRLRREGNVGVAMSRKLGQNASTCFQIHPAKTFQ